MMRDAPGRPGEASPLRKAGEDSVVVPTPPPHPSLPSPSRARPSPSESVLSLAGKHFSCLCLALSGRRGFWGYSFEFRDFLVWVWVGWGGFLASRAEFPSGSYWPGFSKVQRRPHLSRTSHQLRAISSETERMKSSPFQVGWFLSFPREEESKRGSLACFATVVKIVDGEKLFLGDLEIRRSDLVKRDRLKKPKPSQTETAGSLDSLSFGVFGSCSTHPNLALSH